MIIDALQTVALLALVAYVAAGSQRPRLASGRRQILLLDSCAIIDGRIIGAARAGIVAHRIVIPKCVLQELHTIADNRDAYRRNRARLGLENVSVLQKELGAVTETTSQNQASGLPVDEQLIALALRLGATLCTTDYALGKAAEAQGVRVVNMHELAQRLHVQVLPGEKVSVQIIQKGTGQQQGIGYLDDGTMIVVDGAGRMKHKKVTAEVTRIHQTETGKMLFGRISQ